MKVFLSYAHEDRPLAAEIHASLAVRDIDAFFDEADLEGGRAFGEPIERAIEESELFIFLISPYAFDEGSYTINELACAKKKWKNPSGKVLPVMATPTLYSRIDPYLRSVNIVSTQGNVPAEVVSTAVALLKNENPEPKDDLPTPELLVERIASYKALWELTHLLPKWPRAVNVSYEDLRDFSKSLRTWYFTEGGGMFLSRTAHRFYGALQDSLTAILVEKPVGFIIPEHYDAVRDLCSKLRSGLARDVGSRI